MWMVQFGRFVSGTLALIIPGAACVAFVTNAARPLSHFVPLALAIFGTAMALSATCFQVVPTLARASREDPLHAGEKFLHAGILFLQAIAVKYTEEAAVVWLSSLHGKTGWVHVGAVILFAGTASFGANSFLLGFQTLNDWLWSRWVQRVESGRVSRQSAHDQTRDQEGKGTMTQESTNLLPGTRSIMHAILRLGPIWISIAPLYYVMSYVALASYLTPLNATWLASQFPITDVLIRGIGPFAFLLITGFLQEVHELRLSAKARKSSWAMAKFAWTVPILFVLGFWAVSALFPKTGLSIWFAVGAGCAMAAGQIGGAFVVRLEDRSFRWTWSSLLMAAFGLLLALVLAPIGFGMRDGIAITKGTTNLEKVIPKSSASLPYKTPLLLLLHSGGLFYVLDFQHDPSHPRVVVLRGEDVDWVGIP